MLDTSHVVLWRHLAESVECGHQSSNFPDGKLQELLEHTNALLLGAHGSDRVTEVKTAALALSSTYHLPRECTDHNLTHEDTRLLSQMYELEACAKASLRGALTELLDLCAAQLGEIQYNHTCGDVSRELASLEGLAEETVMALVLRTDLLCMNFLTPAIIDVFGVMSRKRTHLLVAPVALVRWALRAGIYQPFYNGEGFGFPTHVPDAVGYAPLESFGRTPMARSRALEMAFVLWEPGVTDSLYRGFEYCTTVAKALDV